MWQWYREHDPDWVATFWLGVLYAVAMIIHLW